ncbi:sodium-dependent phosphate transport 2B, partial [Brachionus plicatilis]
MLYLFLISLNFMTIGFTLVTPYALKAKNVFQFFLNNPFASLAIGIFLTALLQNSTATTSIAVTMVGAGIIQVKDSVPIIMGSNIGTCVTNSFIALSMADNPLEFKRAFSAATLNDFFNYLTTAILLALEIIFEFMTVVSEKLTSLMPDDPNALKKANFVSAILNPLVDVFIKLDEDQVNAVNMGSDTTQVALRCCQKPIYTNEINDKNLTQTIFNLLSQFNISWNNEQTIVLKNYTNLTQYEDFFVKNQTVYQNVTGCTECTYWCMPMLRAFGDGGTGLFWIILSLVVLLACLFGIVKILSLIIVGPIAHGVRRAINATFPGKFRWLMQLILFIVAFLMTLVVQSSNIITATLVPLCGFGIVSLQRVFVMTLGSNIGTTVTGILSAFTQPASALKKSLQLAFVYTLFNVIGVILWLPIPFMRFPKKFARKFGHIVVKYKWFVYIYVSSAYFIIPLFMFAIALIPYWIGVAIKIGATSVARKTQELRLVASMDEIDGLLGHQNQENQVLSKEK